jgi:hypothetical protein
MIQIFSNQTLDVVTAIQVKNNFLIPIKADITKLFGTNKVKFQIYIKENKIIIESPEITTPLVIHESPLQMEALNVS